MNSNTDKVIHTVSMSLYKEDVSRPLIEKRVRELNEILQTGLEEDEIVSVIRKLEASFQTSMNLGHTLKDASYKPWLYNEREGINWFYWNRYKQMLIQNDFGIKVVGQTDIITDKILDLLQNPKDEGSWSRKGLVVGNVQSGKTANYSGVICKALDSGYRVVIVLAGLLNSLRKQTQERMDNGIIGLDSSLMLKNLSLPEKLVGVGTLTFNDEFWPVSITTAHSDFNKRIATELQTSIQQYSRPLVFIIKKNVSILNNLIEWLKNNNFDLNQYPMLLIDDEADHASINTKNSDLDPTRTNDSIRKLLKIFPKNVYLGYTATPFANIFINPETPEDMVNDLFPENFIKVLEPPTNYLGSKRIFLNKDPNLIRIIKDYDSFLPLKHKKEDIPTFLPSSLEDSLRVYVLVVTIRILRGDSQKHNSMLVNVSRFTDIQSQLRILIHNEIVDIRNAISNYYSLTRKEALKCPEIYKLYNLWEKEFSNLEFEWIEVQKTLNKAVSKIEVIEVNGSRNAEKEIDYSSRNYPNGRHLVTVGGLSLSRGITLEGLSISYFLRNSIMYDTLMQMGRWFGYRRNYEDLCRIFMTAEAFSWYTHIAGATEELLSEFEKMDELGKTPKDFGLCVRNHPDSLLVTARNKMRSATTIIREVELNGRLIETSRLYTSEDKVNINLNLMATLIRRLSEFNSYVSPRNTKHLLWKNVPFEMISDFVETFQNHPESSLTDSDTVKKYIGELALGVDIKKWNVLVVNVPPSEDIKVNVKQEELKSIGPGIRRTTNRVRAGVMLSSRKLASEGTEKMDLENNSIRENPLLMLHILDCRVSSECKETPVFPHGVVAYGISFPGDKSGKRIKKRATYQVNTTWMKEQYGDETENDEDIGRDIDE